MHEDIKSLVYIEIITRDAKKHIFQCRLSTVRCFKSANRRYKWRKHGLSPVTVENYRKRKITEKTGGDEPIHLPNQPQSPLYLNVHCSIKSMLFFLKKKT